MTAFEAVVIWPGKDWDNKPEYGGGQKTQAVFLPVGLKDEKDNHIKVNSSDPENKKAKLLKSLKKDQIVWLVLSGHFQGDKDKPYYDVVWFKGHGLSPESTDGGVPETEDPTEEIHRKADLYVQTYKQLRDRFYGLDIPVEPDQLSMMASSIAKQIR